MIGRRWFIAMALTLLTGCKVGPNYKRPTINAPDAYRGLAPDAAPQTTASIADEKWWTVFDDQQLQALIRKAIAQNYDVAVEVLNARRLIKGYSDTHARGESKFDRVIGAVPLLAPRADGADWMRRLRDAALMDENGIALDGALKTVATL